MVNNNKNNLKDICSFYNDVQTSKPKELKLKHKNTKKLLDDVLYK